jgi:hypothetical protein
MNAVARALLGTRVNRFSMLLNAGELTWNAPNTIETNRGKERYFWCAEKFLTIAVKYSFYPMILNKHARPIQKNSTPYPCR